ncbi:MMPL family transporter [Streptomyces durmitorensis]|uniref:MMPL family transporter n=1 Tax=Streptomyces durmitorensis TaxID=319947 RepID=A0ABY4Q756_9ACTN|nr:MMPL family transporter [Streptomyces durmitorensis]UQT60853.1 MMPL family transporter [Streptomyces durmitorensis]
MATFLHRLGLGAFRRRWLTLLFWAVVLGVAGAASAGSSGSGDSNITLPGIEAQKAYDVLGEKYPAANADGASARVVVRAPEGEKLAADEPRAEVSALLKDLQGSSPRVASVADPFKAKTISADGTTGYAQVTYKAKPAELTDADHGHLQDALDAARGQGLTVEASGSALAPAEASSSSEAIGFVLGALILVVTFGSFIAAGMPLLTALLGVGITVSAITALTTALDLNSSTSSLATMLGIAVGIDYSLFIVSRYRSERAVGHDAREAAARANGTAGSAVVFAGLTVVIALVGLAVVNLPILTAMGMAAAGAVVVVVLVSVTLVPALLAFAPERVLGRASRKKSAGSKAAGTNGSKAPGTNGSKAADTKPPLAERWAGFVLRSPWKILLLAVLGLGVIALPATRLELSLPDDSTKPTSTTERKAYDMLAESFGPGFNGPLTLVVSGSDPAATKNAVGQLDDSVRDMKDVATVAPATYNPAGDTAMVALVPKSPPASEETKDLVHTIRDQAKSVQAATGALAMVTGTTAMNIDVAAKFADAIIPYLALVVGLAFLVLILVFRSILVPLKAALGFLLSVLASLGAVVAVFQWGWLKGLFGLEATGPIMSLMPILLVGIVFGLAMDYQVFLVTRIREAHVHGADPRRAITEGFRHSGKVVIAAALIMTGVFAGFIGGDDAMIKSLGFGLAIGVVLDAFVVRMTIVPAVLALLGGRAWSLPGWLDRRLPHVDVEGEKLGSTAPAVREPAPREADSAPTR